MRLACCKTSKPRDTAVRRTVCEQRNAVAGEFNCLLRVLCANSGTRGCSEPSFVELYARLSCRLPSTYAKAAPLLAFGQFSASCNRQVAPAYGRMLAEPVQGPAVGGRRRVVETKLCNSRLVFFILLTHTLVLKFWSTYKESLRHGLLLH